MEYVWYFKTEARAAEVAEHLTAQNRAGRQALGCIPRRFVAQGRWLYAEPL